ncbi:thioredoxin [Sphingobacterium alkalisoli]|uniref:Thioredoxin n=1 Tax=Sphingobacterium alkalisoli TaxID=1874115 RepID=A0A4U0H249_9SPHI|nr:thioredoxin [Sphingobacterium alkalisoli]TJY65528.1 thioredoxin [Sphingobacterium alkalisoli]GGH19912.1 thioredoxin [Sphingobacterium alkalisoli]
MASFNEIIQKNTIVLVDFSAEWCGPCQTLAPILKEVKTHFGDKLTVIKIDVDRNQPLAANFKVQGVPTLILFKNGNQTWRQSGLLLRSDLIAIIEKQLD